MSPVIGIDLGTTNTVVAVVQDGHASAIQDEDGHVLLPSVVSFHPSGNVLVGRAAKDRRLVDSVNTIYSIKRLIGRSWDSEEVRRARSRFPFQMKEGPGQASLVVARGESYTLPEISAFVLRKAKSIAEAALGTSVERAVITVPANFNDLQRAATKVAGRVAGLEVMRILNEPTAAALAYGYGKATSERIAVYDFGGGTFDVTLLDLSDNVFEVLATAGNTFLGGDDLDLLIAERMAETFLARHRYDPRTDQQVFEHLKVAAEDIKHQLSEAPEATVELKEVAHGPGGKPLALSFSMTRGELEKIAAPLIDRTFEVCREALGIARLSPSDFQQLLLVGGSTRIPLVKRRVEDFWKRELRANISPDEVVAIGAAIQASALSGAERRRGTVPPPPHPARLPHAGGSERPSALARRRTGGTSPPGQRPRSDTAPGPSPALGPVARPRMDTSPDAFGIPSTQPFGGGRSPLNTVPGLQHDADPADPARHPALGVFGRAARNPSAEPAGERPRLKTGAGLGPAAQRVIAAATLHSASEEAASARAVAAGANLPLVAPEVAAAPTETSVAFQLADDDIEDLTGPPAPEPPGVRSLAQPMSSKAAQATENPALRVPELPEDEPTRVGAPSPLELARAREEGLAMLLAQQVQAPPAVPAPPRAPAPQPAPTYRTAPMQVAGTTTQRLLSSPPPPIAPPVQPPPPPVLVDVTPLTLAVETVEGFCDSIIGRNTTVPCERTREFVTAADNQTSVRVRVSQGESKRFAENTLLGEVELSGLRPARRGDVRIAVSFALDSSGMLVVSAKDVGTGQQTSTQVHLVGLPDAQEVARMAARQAAHGM